MHNFQRERIICVKFVRGKNNSQLSQTLEERKVFHYDQQTRTFILTPEIFKKLSFFSEQPLSKNNTTKI